MFDYIDVALSKGKKLDHKAGVAEYAIQLEKEREAILRDRKFQNWVIDRNLLKDDWFLDKVERMFIITREEIKEREEEEEYVNISEYWEIIKREEIKVAKAREKELYLKEPENILGWDVQFDIKKG